jgi:hypothetical protein
MADKFDNIPLAYAVHFAVPRFAVLRKQLSGYVAILSHLFLSAFEAKLGSNSEVL